MYTCTYVLSDYAYVQNDWQLFKERKTTLLYQSYMYHTHVFAVNLFHIVWFKSLIFTVTKPCFAENENCSVLQNNLRRKMN